MILFSMKDIVFRPIYPLSTMLIIVAVCAVIIILNHKHIINRFLILALLLIISQRPMLKNQEGVAINLNLDILFVIDNTVSMNAVDVNGKTRLEVVKEDCKKIIASYPGASYAIVTYSNRSQVKYPFTSDMSTILDVIDNMKIIDPVYANGSTLDMPYDDMRLLLESSIKKDKHHQIVFFMGDGELVGKEKDNNDLSKYNNIKGLIKNGAVLGYGTAEGSKVKIYESVKMDIVANSEGYLIDGNSSTKAPAISKMNEANLRSLASVLSLDYYHLTDFSLLEKKIEEIKDTSEENEDDEDNMDKDIYYYFSGALIVLLAIELFHNRRDEQ